MADVNVQSLSDYLQALAAGNTPKFSQGAGAVADTISARDYTLNKKGYVAAAEKAGFKLNVVADGATLADYQAANFLKIGRVDGAGVVLIRADNKINAISVPTVGRVDLSVGQYKAQAAINNGYLKAMDDAGNTVGVFIRNPSLAEFKAAAAVRGDDSLVSLQFSGDKKPVTLSGDDYLDNPKFVDLLQANGFAITVNVDPAKVSLTEYQQIVADTGVVVKLANAADDGAIILVQRTPQAVVASIEGNGYTVKIKAATASLKDYLAAKALSNGGQVILPAPVKGADSVTVPVASFAGNVEYVQAALAAGFKVFVLAAGSTEAAYNEAVAAVGDVAGVQFKLKAANPASPQTIKFTADDYLDSLGYVTALKNSGYLLAVTAVDATKYTNAEMQTLFAKGATVAVIKAAAGADPIALTGREYSDNLAYVKGMIKAGYGFSVVIDPTAVSVAEYKAILANKAVTSSVLAADLGESVSVALKDFKTKAGADYVKLLEDNGYTVKVKPDSLTLADFKKAFDFVSGDMSRLDLPQAPAGAAAVTLKLADFDQNYVDLLGDAGYQVKLLLPNVSLDAFNSAKSLIGNDSHITIVMPKAPVAGATGGTRITVDDYLDQTGVAGSYLETIQSFGYKLPVQFDPTGDSLAEYQQLLADSGVALVILRGNEVAVAMTAADYFANPGFIKAIEAAGYNPQVSFDPMLNSVADYRKLLADKNVSVTLVAAASGEQVELTLAEYGANAAFVALLQQAGYGLNIAANSASVSDLFGAISGISALPANVTMGLAIHDSQVDEAAAMASLIAGKGFDSIAAVDGTLSVSSTELTQFKAAGLVLDKGSETTLNLAPGDLVGGNLSDATIGNAVAMNVDLLNGQVHLTDQQAGALIAGGIEFTSASAVTLHAEGTVLNTSLKSLQVLGVDTVVGLEGASVPNLAVNGEGADFAGGLPSFNAGLNVDLQLADADVGAAAANAVNLKAAGIDLLGAKDGSIADSTAAFTQIRNGNLSFDAKSDVTQTLAAGDLTGSALNNAIDTAIAVHADHLDVSAPSAIFPNGAVDITAAQATKLISAGIDFAANDHVVVHADSTHLNTSLKDLQKLGVDTVLVDGGAATVVLHAGGPLVATGLPDFTGVQNVELLVTGGAIGEVVQNAAALRSAGVDRIGVETAANSFTAGGHVDLTQAQTTTLASNTLAMDLANDVSMKTGSGSVTLSNADVAALQSVRVDHVDGSAASAVHLNDTQAAALLQSGIDFTADTTNAVIHSQGTQLNTSLKDLQKLGVDTVLVDGASDVVLHAGGAALSSALPSFTGVAGKAELLVASSVTVADVVANAAALNAADIELIGFETSANSFVRANTHVDLTQAQATTLNTNNIGFANATDVTMDFGGSSLSAGNLSLLDNVNVDHVRATAALDLTDAQAGALLQQGVDFTASSNVTLHAAGTELNTSLKNLQKLGVDTVVADVGSALVLHAGDSVAATGLPDFNGVADVELLVNAASIGQVAQNAAALHGAGIDRIGIETSPVSFADNGEVALTEAQASALLQGGLEFSANSGVTMHAGGTQLNTSLKSLQTLGVDTVDSTDHVATHFIDLGVGAIDPAALPTFDNMEANVEASDTRMADLDALAGGLAAAGVDELTVELDGSLANNAIMGANGITSANIQGSNLDLVLDVAGTAADLATVLEAADGSSNTLTTALAGSHDLVATLQAVGVLDIHLDENASITLEDDEIHALLSNNMLSAESGANVVANFGDATPGATLMELSQLGVDAVHFSAAATLLDLGQDFGGNLQGLKDFLTAQYQGPTAIGTGNEGKTVVLDLHNVNADAVVADAAIMAKLQLIGVDHIKGSDGLGGFTEKPVA